MSPVNSSRVTCNVVEKACTLHLELVALYL
jgi:hypothetical protein